jgi:hypothetical protein
MSTNSNTSSNTSVPHSTINTTHNSFIDTYLRQTPTSTEAKKNNTDKIGYRTISYNLDSSISKDFNSVYTNLICATLLKNDCVLFGDFVIEFFSKNVLNFAKTIYAYGDLSLKNIIERDLYGKIYTKKKQEFPIYGYIEYKYKCVHDNNIYDIVIYYLNYIQKLETSFIKGQMPLNIDTLTISRKGIEVISYLDDSGQRNDIDVPLPFGNLVEDIINKRFYINTKVNKISQLNRILLYINNGWKNASTTLLKEKQSTYIGRMCEICHDKILKGEKVSILKCKHFFHRECWHETLKQHITSTKGDVICCPTCRKNYYLHDVL